VQQQLLATRERRRRGLNLGGAQVQAAEADLNLDGRVLRSGREAGGLLAHDPDDSNFQTLRR
jgi:hypothetical protein